MDLLPVLQSTLSSSGSSYLGNGSMARSWAGTRTSRNGLDRIKKGKKNLSCPATVAHCDLRPDHPFGLQCFEPSTVTCLFYFQTSTVTCFGALLISSKYRVQCVLNLDMVVKCPLSVFLCCFWNICVLRTTIDKENRWNDVRVNSWGIFFRDM